MLSPNWLWIIVIFLLLRDVRSQHWAAWIKMKRDSVGRSSTGSKGNNGRVKTSEVRRKDTARLSILASLPPTIRSRPVLIPVLAALISTMVWNYSTNDDFNIDERLGILQSLDENGQPLYSKSPFTLSWDPGADDAHPGGYEDEDLSNYPTEQHMPTSPAVDYERIDNETLGFEKVYVVNLPERADKRDALSLIGALNSIKLTWVNAFKGKDIPDKALPLGVDRRHWRDGGIGSWRSQMNVIRTMVEENVESALILEDDVDWDVRLKSQLVQFAEGARTLLDLAKQEPAFIEPRDQLSALPSAPVSPYGDGWDILWLGHCGETFPERIPGHEMINLSLTRYKYYAIRDDETLPPAEHAESWISGDLKRHPGVRRVHFSGGPTCSAAYALSQSGARKILLALSVGKTLVAQLDNAMSDLCRDHTPWDAPDDVEGPPGYPGARMRCFSVTPAVFSQHKPRGIMAAGSDIETVEGGDEVREVGESPNLMYSARLNAQNLILGRPMVNQFEGAQGRKWEKGADMSNVESQQESEL